MTEKWNPVDYHRHSYPQYAFALGLLERLRLNGDERILDVGCGDGKVTAALAARVPRGSVLGIDASPGHDRVRAHDVPRVGASEPVISLWRRSEAHVPP